MPRRPSRVYQFKITLRDITPAIWRRIQIEEDSSFWGLHVAIQDAMGWLDCHLHAFRVRNPSTGAEEMVGIPADDGFGDPFLPGWELFVADYFTTAGETAMYEYDFGDGWEHEVVLEEVVASTPRGRYPRCLAGERACPPEDCGGVGGYEDFLKIIADPSHDEHEEMLEWAGGKFDPEAFDSKKVRFDDPGKRFQRAFGGEVL